MPTPPFEHFNNEVMELTTQPEVAVIERRAHRRRVRRWVTSSVAAVVALQLAGALAWAGALPGRSPAKVAASPSPSASAYPAGPVWWADAADQDHLYALLYSCQTCPMRLVGSDDGGRTWSTRHEGWTGGVGVPQVIGPRTLFTSGAPESYDHSTLEPALPAAISTDGGRTWVPLSTSSTPTAHVPAGGWLDCSHFESVYQQSIEIPGKLCHLTVVDPKARTIRPLVPPAGITPYGAAAVPVEHGLWVAGLDGDGWLNVSVSHDGGLTWTTHRFGELPRLARDKIANVAGYSAAISTFDGQTAYAVIGFGSATHGYQTTDGGRTWTPVGAGAGLPHPSRMDGPAITLPDGTFVLQRQVNGKFQPLVSIAEADRLRPDDLRDWPPTLVFPDRNGWYTAVDGWTFYRSQDGVHWWISTVAQ